ncbi:MAG: glycosyltransferase [Proteobacteria bacterium]|nr:glycosyltransferase [Pseudomonadota bacterium]
MPPSPLLVMHVIPGLRTGGAEHMLATLVAAKRRNPYRQVVVNLLKDGANADRIRAAGVELIELDMRHPVMLPIAVVRLARMIRRMQPDAIQSWLYYGDLSATAALAVSGRRPITRLYWGLRCSDMDLSRYHWGLRQAIALCARWSGKPDAVIANSFAGRDVHRQLGYRPRAFPVIPNGIDTVRFRPDAAARDRIRQELGIAGNRPIIIHAARVDPMKDHASLIAAARDLPDATFVLAGARTETLQTPDNMIALGARTDMPDLYAAADIAVSSSAFGEGFSNAIAEAMASGVPAVSTDVGDAAAIIGAAGRLVPPRDPGALRDALATLLAEPPDAREARGRASRHHIEQTFSLHRVVDNFDRLFAHGTLPEE